jgi:hypothetical protein
MIYINADGQFYEGDIIPGDREATEEEIATRQAALDLAAIPHVVTMRQARLAMFQAGIYQTVKDTVAALPGPEGELARIEWDYSTVVDRNQPLTVALVAQLGLTDEQINQLFAHAATL